MNEFYLDACIFIGYYFKKDKYNKKIVNFIKELSTLNEVRLVSSALALTESVKRLLDLGMSGKKVRTLAEQLARKPRIGNLRFNWLPVHPEKVYDFGEFFYDVQEKMLKLKPRPSFADSIHCGIMENNKVKNFITTDSEFKKLKISNLRVIDPDIKEVNKILQG